MVKLLLNKKVREKNRTRIFPLLIFKNFAIGFLAKKRNNFVPECNYHHVVPVTRIPDGWFDVLDDAPYVKLTRAKYHQNFHDMFDNRTPKEVILCACQRLRITKKIDCAAFRNLNKSFVSLYHTWKMIPENLQFSDFERHSFDAFCENRDIEQVFEIILEMMNVFLVIESNELYNPDSQELEKKSIQEFRQEIRRISQEFKK